MKIAFIGQKGIPAVQGGVEKHVEEIATRLVKRGHEVFVYVRYNYTDKNVKEYKGVKLIYLPSVSSKHLDAVSHTFLATLHAIFQNYDLVHYQAIGPSLLVWLFKTFRSSVPLVATFHCQDYYHQKWGWLAKKFLQLGEYLICKIPDRTIVVSKILSEYSLQKYGTKTAVIPNGAESRFNEKNDALKSWKLEDKKYILSVSRLIRHKGIHYLIEAFKRLEDSGCLPDNLKLAIVGDGFHTDDYVKYLNAISENRKSIVFTGRQSGEVLEQLFSHACFFVQPSESEGLSLALLEAMGYGLTPLVSDIPENTEPVGTSGYTFKNKNVCDLQDKLAYLLTNIKETENMGLRAKERAQKEYGWDSIADKTLAEYEKITSKNKK